MPAADGWEQAAATRQRVAVAVHGLLAKRPDQLVLVGHGTAWTLLVAALTGLAPGFEAWRAMGMPDRCALDVAPGRPARLALPWGEIAGREISG